MKLLISPRIYSHPRTLEAGHAAIGVWLRAGCWLAEFPDQGEFVPSGVVRHLRATKEANALVRAGLWKSVKGGYRMLRYVSPISGLPIDERPLWSVAREDYRRKIPADIRDRVYERDENRCSECGSIEDLSLDHVHPWSLGGADTEDNLRVLCRPCNSRKGARI